MCSKIHTTNYKNTFIEVADDCPVDAGEIPPDKKSGKTIANIQYELISENPYKYTSDDVLFKCYAIKNSVTDAALKASREKFFSKGQPCFRASPLAKQYGWGIHHDEKGKIAIYGCDTNEYKTFVDNDGIKKLKAMKSKKK